MTEKQTDYKVLSFRLPYHHWTEVEYLFQQSNYKKKSAFLRDVLQKGIDSLKS
tara:strand:- start:264 stop:422 length:159 start_codon:yes stop_codon:yes gene_type:complete